ncbi:MAG: hypothetical protein JF600_07015 [Xanthomonadales bacterium]|nr:hypothetical protein [Xanthomonadales bacterium]
MSSARDWREALTDTLRRALRIETTPEVAAAALHALSPGQWLALDEALRRAWWRPAPPGPAWSPSMPPREREPDAQLFCIGCHADGHLRERALRLSQTREGRLADALAAIRCDDWVAPVRACAEDALRQRVERDAGWPFERIDLLLALSRRERFRDGAWCTLLAPALLAPAQAERRWALLGHPHPQVRMFACRTIAQADPERATELAAWALAGRDPVIALWAIRDLPGLAGIAFDDALLARAERSRFAPVRAQAMRVRAQRPDAVFADRVRAALLDPHPSVRSVAAFAARALGIDARGVWRAAIDQAIDRAAGPAPRGAVLGLAEQAQAEDVARLRPSLDDASGDLRCAVLRGLMRAGIDDALPMLRDALAAPQGKVVRLALTLGKGVPGVLSRDTLVAAYGRAANVRARRLLLDATWHLGPWQSLDMLFDLGAQRPDDADVAQALRHWPAHAGRRYASLSPERRAALLARIDAIAAGRPDADWRTIRWIVETGVA